MVITITGDPAWLIFHCIRSGERPVSAQAGPLEEGARGRGRSARSTDSRLLRGTCACSLGGPGFSVGLGGAPRVPWVCSDVALVAPEPDQERSPRDSLEPWGPAGHISIWDPVVELSRAASTALSVLEKAESERPREPCSPLLELERVLESAADADPESCGARQGCRATGRQACGPPGAPAPPPVGRVLSL